MAGWLRCLTPQAHAEARLVCFPHAGGTAAFFAPWQRAASPFVEVHTVQYPGRADRLREDPVDDSPTLVRLLADAVVGLFDRPVAFFGHSMGGVLAFETARLLSARGLPPAHLFVSASRPPRFAARDEKPLSGVDDDALVAALGDMGGSDARILAMPEMRELVLPAVRADFRLVEGYRYRPGLTLSCPITAYAGADDTISPAASLPGWSEVTTGSFSSMTYPGGHFYLQDQSTDVLADVEGRLRATASVLS